MNTLRSLERRVQRLERASPQRVVTISAPDSEEAFEIALAEHEWVHGPVDRKRDLIVHVLRFCAKDDDDDRKVRPR